MSNYAWKKKVDTYQYSINDPLKKKASMIFI